MAKAPTYNANTALPLLPLRDVVVFPHMVLPLFVGREKSVHALETAMAGDKKVLLVAQLSPEEENPKANGIHKIGTVANILQLLKLPDGTVKVLVEGLGRVNITAINDGETHFSANCKALLEKDDGDVELEAMRRTLLSQFEQYIKLNKKIPQEILGSLNNLEKAGQLADTIAVHLDLSLDKKQVLLATPHIKERFLALLQQLDIEMDLLQVEKRIRGRVKGQMDKNQREYYLNEQIKAIQKELGEEDEEEEFEAFTKRIKNSGMSKEAREKATSELKKLKTMQPSSAEASVIRNYLDTLLGLPWKKASKINTDIAKAEATLDADHHGLEKVKERIVEYLAVQQRVDKIKSPILCLVGPPGVGKTSLGESIARATGREFVRMALGGVRDESEVRGHRRTYIGSMPGKILQNMSKVGVKNPLFLLDEIDKLGNDFRGDPASALLEVLDPEQNHSFIDHYAEVEYDLSNVMFVATANSLNIPPALLDRMEVIYLSGYTEDEKVSIAEHYLVPKQLKNNGVTDTEIKIENSALRDIVRYYTRESGVRNLDREINKICRKVVTHLAKKPSKTKASVTDKTLGKYLGVQRYDFGLAAEKNSVGQVTGLAWTEVGGELLTIEAVTLTGKGNVIRTGTLGDVMQESITAAMSIVRSRAASLGLRPDFYEKMDMHIHVPEGATPKDGPSAGVGMTTAIVSALTGIPVRADLAMTGEITLRGEVLAIGGLKEKLLAAQRGGIKQVLIPKDNMKDLEDIPDSVKQHILISPVKWIDEVLTFALTSQPMSYNEDVTSPTVTLSIPKAPDNSNPEVKSH
jgi:ATP-dependent Lon protease